MTRTRQRGARRRVSHNKTPSKLAQEVRNVTNSIRDLNLQTANRMLPSVPDIVPMSVNKRQIYTFERSFYIQVPVNGGGSPASGQSGQLVSFSPAASIPNWSEFQSLFNQYRILQVQLRFEHFPPLNASSGVVNDYSILTAFQYDTRNLAPIASDIIQYESYMQFDTTSGAGYFQRTFTPAINISLSPTSGTGISIVKQRWIATQPDATNPSDDATYYGLVAYFNFDATLSPQQYLPVPTRVIFQCRTVL